MDTAVLLISLAIIPVLMAIIILCLKIKTSKDHGNMGVAGTVKLKNPDDAYTLASSNTNRQSLPGEDPCVRTPDYNRKLPDIPSDVTEYKNNNGKDDNSSELYATVDENPQPTSSSHPVGATNTQHLYVPPNHPYAQVKKHPRREHPYAKVGATVKDDSNADVEDDVESETEGYETADNLLADQACVDPQLDTSRGSSGRSASAGGASSWVAPTARRPDDIPNSHSRQATPLPPEPTGEASQQQAAVQHFSGDSQDSMSKGYTSISVREPLSMIRPIAVPEHPPLMEGTYAAWSETSDDMYAAIDDTVYTNPGTSVGVDQPTRRQGPELPLPGRLTPPSVSRSMIETESEVDNMYSKVDKTKKRNDRQSKPFDATYATVSKRNDRASLPNPANSQVSLAFDGAPDNVNLGARPKQRSPQTQFRNMHHPVLPYERRSNSEAIDYSAFEMSLVDSERHRSQEKLLHSLTPDFHHTRNRVVDHRREQSLDASWSHTGRSETSNVNTREPGYETVPYAHSTFSNNSDRDMGYEVLPNREPGYETVPHRKERKDPGYETVPSRKENSDPGYETVPSELIDPGYEVLPHRTRVGSVDPGYETVPPKSELIDPGYESVKRPSDPGYETVPHQVGNARNSGYMSPPPPQRNYTYTPQSYLVYDNGYETLPQTRETSYKPGNQYRDPEYESVLGARRDPGYESIHRPHNTSSSTLEPGYETVSERTPATKHSVADTDTEVRYSQVNKKGKNKATAPVAPHLLAAVYRNSEPELSHRREIDINYETLPEKERQSGNNSESEEGYETIPANKRNRNRTEDSEGTSYDPEYETVQQRLQSDPGYETIPTRDTEVLSEVDSNTDPSYARLGQLEDNSDDEPCREIERIQEEDTTVESSQGNSLIHMSVVDKSGGNGARRSSVVMIEHVDMTPVPSADLDNNMDPNVHIFV